MEKDFFKRLVKAENFLKGFLKATIPLLLIIIISGLYMKFQENQETLKFLIKFINLIF